MHVVNAQQAITSSMLTFEWQPCAELLNIPLVKVLLKTEGCGVWHPEYVIPNQL